MVEMETLDQLHLLTENKQLDLTVHVNLVYKHLQKGLDKMVR